MNKMENDELEIELLSDVLESQQASALEYGVPVQHEYGQLFNVSKNKFVFLKFEIILNKNPQYQSCINLLRYLDL